MNPLNSMMKVVGLVSVVGLVTACGATNEDDPTATPTPTSTPVADTTPTPDPTPTSEPTPTPDTGDTGVLTNWLINTTDELSDYVDNGGTFVNVQSVDSETIGDVDYAVVSASGIPDYEVLMTEGLVEWLNSRPKAATDFYGSETAAVAGELYGFGADVGYINDQCDVGAGQGYWPPGPACPSNQSNTGYFPVEPTETTTECDMGLNAIGYAINGVSIFGWQDGQSYNGQGDWNNLASIAEVYDVDICGGHAAGTNYHHHHYSDCWARAAGEDWDGHSEIYGYAADGYPVYGPYEDTGVLAQSCWVKRDYDVGPEEAGYGCVGFSGSIEGERTCVLVDPYDPSQGVVAADSEGPTTSDTVESLSRNTFVTTAGFYFQDYYYNSACTDLGGEYLDQYNGHSDEVRGYHYHLTLEQISQGDDVPVTPTFPFTYGPRFAGELGDNAVAGCDSGDAGGGPPGR